MSLKDFEKNETDYEDKVASRYNRDYHSYPIMQQHDLKFAEYASRQFKAYDRILDLGCASASMWPYWLSKLVPHQTLIGVDLSQGMIDEAKLKFPQGDFRQGSLFEIPVESGSVDLIILSSVIHHIPDSEFQSLAQELYRVLDEHGTIVGREPLQTQRLTERSKWLSDAVLHFRHLIFHKTRTREYPEPPIGDHHHAYDAEEFIKMMNQRFRVSDIAIRNPFSPYVARCASPKIVEFALLLDETLQHKAGQELYYTAKKNFSQTTDIERCVELELKNNLNLNPVEPEFLAMLQVAASKIDAFLEDEQS